MKSRLITAGCLLMASAAMTGCAQLIIDADGNRHLIGFMALTLPAPQFDVGADVVRMRTVGLTVTRGEASGTSLVLGYGDTTVAAVRNDSSVTHAALLRATQNKSSEVTR